MKQLALLALTLLPALARAEPAVPSVFCPDVLDVSEDTEDCNDNGTFLSAARGCENKLNGLEAQLGQTAEAVAAGGSASQFSKTKTGARTYQFSAASAAYLDKVATVGLAQLTEYPDYVFLPEDSDAVYQSDDGNPYPSAQKSSCYSSAQSGIQQVQDFFRRKIALYQNLEKSSAVNDASLETSAGNMGSLFSGSLENQPKTDSSSGSTPKIPYQGSDVSGTQEEKSK